MTSSQTWEPPTLRGDEFTAAQAHTPARNFSAAVTATPARRGKRVTLVLDLKDLS